MKLNTPEKYFIQNSSTTEFAHIHSQLHSLFEINILFYLKIFEEQERYDFFK